MKRAVQSCALILGVGCATRPATPAPAAVAVASKDIRELRIVPNRRSACPGDVIDASYVARLADGATVTLGAKQLPLLARSAVAADPRGDGSWQTDGNPLHSVASGFRLSVALRDDSTVRADTVVAPSYSCRRGQIGLPRPDRYSTTKAYVRLAVFASRFHDSVVVAVVEREGEMAGAVVLGPKEMESGAIRISAPGTPGARGGNGPSGADGAECANGGAGEDGDPGEPGSEGGQVDLIVETGSPWLAELVTVFNPGGPGGPGGSGGRGGRAGQTKTDARGVACRTTQGIPGRSGRSGPPGSSGPRPRTTLIPFTLLWSGSPVWADPLSRRALEELIAFDATRR